MENSSPNAVQKYPGQSKRSFALTTEGKRIFGNKEEK
jgi:hypothetical protein